ncbi:hypothetical protein EK904_014991 [Melospiza melodia maxima]|nr:hypothetical protein EK904_014991 [Melospiza melodia maxima]
MKYMSRGEEASDVGVGMWNLIYAFGLLSKRKKLLDWWNMWHARDTDELNPVWVGSVTEITVDDLCAEDKDSSPSELVYSITPPSNGHLALKSSPNKSILAFTQTHIIKGQLVFVHNGM